MIELEIEIEIIKMFIHFTNIVKEIKYPFSPFFNIMFKD